MKIYAIVATIVAVLAIAAAGYFFMQANRSAGLSDQLEGCQKDKATVESQLSRANSQLGKIEKTVAVFKSVNEAFMIAGDLKALTVGSKEAADVEQKIGGITDSQDRMMVENNWSDFKSSLRLNSLFAFFRDLANNLERTLQQSSDNP